MEQRGRLWLVAGIVLVIVAVLSNAPGLDTTLLLSVDEDGQAPWGSARTVDPLASDPNSSTELTQAAWLDPLGLGLLGVRLAGLASLAVLAPGRAACHVLVYVPQYRLALGITSEFLSARALFTVDRRGRAARPGRSLSEAASAHN